MPYIGQEPVAGNFVLLDAITTSATATYALTKNSVAYSPESSRNMIVSLNGVTQAPETAYTVSGSNITFSSALTASDVIDYILVLGDVLDIGRPSDGVVGTDQMNYPLGNFSSTGIDDNATSTAITIDSSQRVGIGTSSPFGELSIKSASPQVYLETVANGNVQINFNETADQLDVMVNNSNGKIAFGTNSTERMRIDSSGNVTIDGSDASTSLASTAILNLKAGDANNEYSILRFATSADGSIAYIGAKATTTGAYPSSVGNLQFGVQNGASAVTAMTLDSSGNLLVGTTDSAFVNGGGIKIANSQAARLKLCDSDSAGTGSTDGFELTQSGTAAYIYQNENDFMAFGTNATERMRIDSGGNLLVGTTSASAKLTIVQPSGADREVILAGIDGVSNGFQVRYISGAMQYVLTGLGTGTVSSSAGVLSASSDQNMKIADGCVDNALDKISALTPRYFYWKDENGNSDIDKGRQLGFFAQEVNKVVPEAAPEPRDDQNGWGVLDRSLVATLVKAIQEQQAMIEELKAEVAALKGA